MLFNCVNEYRKNNQVLFISWVILHNSEILYIYTFSDSILEVHLCPSCTNVIIQCQKQQQQKTKQNKKAHTHTQKKKKKKKKKHTSTTNKNQFTKF